MSSYDLKVVESRIDFASKLLSFAFKLGVLVGGACLLFYCYRLNYFPVGISIGDGFLLILLATSFGIIYGLFVIGLTALGLWFTPILRLLQKLVLPIRQRWSKRRINEPLEFVRPDFSAFIFGVVGLIFIVALYKLESSAIWTLPVVSFFLGVLFSIYQNSSSKLDEFVKVEAAIVIPPEIEFRRLNLNRDQLRIVRMLSLIAIFITPLLVGGVSGVLMEGVMRFSSIKKGPSYVMLRTPYSNFIPSNFQAKQSPQVPEYTTFESVDVLFSGMGQKSLIEFKVDKKTQRLEIPNESMLVVPR